MSDYKFIEPDDRSDPSVGVRFTLGDRTFESWFANGLEARNWAERYL